MAKNQKELNDYFKRLDGVVKHLHLDVVDGKFANNKVLDFPLRLSKDFNYSAHLMVEKPLLWIKKYLDKVWLIIPHIETFNVDEQEKYIAYMKKNNKKVAFALLPETKASVLKKIAKDIDYVLLLSVHPGFYGSKFIPVVLRKIPQIKKYNSEIKVIIDGGMNPDTIKLAARYGADNFVSGSYTSKAENPKQRIRTLLKSIREVI